MEKLLVTEKKWVYSELVQHDNDVLGIVAYALYKKEKHETATQYRKQGKNEDYIAEQISAFHDQVASVATRQDGYRERAKQVLSATVGLAIEKGLDQLNEQYTKLEAGINSQQKALDTKQAELKKREQSFDLTVEQKVKKEITKVRKEEQSKLARASQNLIQVSIFRRTVFWVLNGFSGIVATTITGIAILTFAAYTADEATQKSLLQDVAKYFVELMSADPVPISTDSLEAASKEVSSQ
ncbi:hypothetical protein L5M43_06310 [Shewanella sp. SW36]|uniref:hypothetical protein n=1 Tax=unclassified Shewanella TaxID=196818 RepID=UPI0021DB43EE|nr:MULTISPECIES: hypothetical protein [unclassified Shewanella]MCU7974892.1 hypothetical protein [Shewanella sp. SW36]MCU7990281.1 hypothetical protein [Shewanella sp. SW1]MCU8052739.1 hypothetical protein [Shewanella sp. SM43]